MKRLLILMLLLLSGGISQLMAQNGGQYMENNALKIQWLNSTTIRMTNKLSCTSTIEVKDTKQTYNLTQGGYIDIPGVVGLRARTINGCGQYDVGWLELSKPLPVVFGNVAATIHNNQLHVRWNTESEVNNAYFVIQTSPDGITFRDVETIQPNNTGQYMANIALTGTLFGFGLLFLPIIRKKWVRWTTMIVMCVAVFACTKQGNIKASKGGDILLRIKNVDINGDINYSKVVKVTS